MSSSGGETVPARASLDRRVLVGNLVSGAVFLVPLALLAWPLSLVGAAYVALAGVFLAAVYGRDELTNRREVLAWATPWLAAVALWTWLLSGLAAGSWLSALGLGLVVATPCYLAWQTVALAVRQVLTWRDGGSNLPSDGWSPRGSEP